MIRFDQVSKSYISGQLALDQVSFEVPTGQMAFLTGHSGAGKTTILKMLMMIERPNRGQVFVNGQNLTRLTRFAIPHHRRSIGMVFQNPNLLPNRTIFENVALPLNIEGYKPYEIKRRVHAALDKVNLLDKVLMYPQQLSSGEQQRVGIARAVVTTPDLLLADEPTGNLDPELSQDIMQLFEAFNNVGVTILIASHDLGLIAKLNHHVITLEKGRVIAGANIDE